jgi:hypothetical protein
MQFFYFIEFFTGYLLLWIMQTIKRALLNAFESTLPCLVYPIVLLLTGL